MFLQVRELIGKILNFAGFASPIRECDYGATVCKAHVVVKQHPLFTVISVNGLDIYFHRLTGEIDGVGLVPSSEEDGVLCGGNTPGND